MTDPRPNAILVCFVCEPGAGSEEGVGWSWTKAAAQFADVTVLTTERAAPAVRAEVAALGLPVEVRPVDLPVRLLRLFPRKLVFVYYVIWQTLAGREVRRLERAGAIDVVHHVTWASDSLPSALLASKAPVRIWGPVGGSTKTALGLYRYLGRRGKIDQAFRDVVNGSLRAVFGRRAARHATLVAALNHDVAHQFRRCGTPVALQGNLALDPAELAVPDDGHPLIGTDPSLRTALFVGRLIPWKGLLLAVRALVHAPGWRMVVVGEGPERAPAEALAAELGVADRIEYLGRIPRRDVLAAFAHVDALLMPSFHDSAPWSVGEAAALGCPVVCLDAGGPALMAGSNGHVVAIGRGHRLPERIAAALDQLDGRGAPDDRWAADRLPELLHGWYRGEAKPFAAAAHEASR